MRRALAAVLSALCALVLLTLLAAPAEAHGRFGEEKVRPLARAHAHNDYEPARPLFDALDKGFTSVEADIECVGSHQTDRK